jgi:hypothetical protein
MHLDEYVAREGRGTLERLRDQTKLAYTTLYRAKRREPIKTWEAAKAISIATGGVVSIPELCEPAPLTFASATGAP